MRLEKVMRIVNRLYVHTYIHDMYLCMYYGILMDQNWR